MNNRYFALSLATLCLSTSAIAASDNASPSQNAMRDTLAYEITEGLTTEVGQRQGGTEAEQRGRDWAVAKLNALGFANVREEKFDMPTWVRGEEKAWVISPFQNVMAATALGNSGSTGAKPLEGEVIYFRTLDDLVAAPDARVAGKIVFVDHQMKRAQDGSGYGQFGRARFIGPNIAAKKGAAAILIRSIGTDSHRGPHTGNTNFEAGVKPIPAAAISNPDADNLTRQVMRAKTPVKVRLLLTPQNLGQQKSGNVIAEVPGSDPSLPPIVIACHLDSWDLGTGAIDDASGCGIITAAASYLQNRPAPKRTVRLLWAGAEEVGIWGGRDYAEKHKGTPHALAMESDFGADRVWRVDFKLPDSAKPLADRIASKLASLGITRGKDPASGGADVAGIIAAQDLAVIDLQQDGTRYFDLHHTPDDTLDKVDPEQMRQNVVAWTMVLEEVANYAGDLSMAPKS
ncbi:MAG: M28 family peptidase [Sphingomonadales bacterium]